MTDRFDAQLRQHLLGEANERPAEGQLATIVETVAVTPQRPKVVAGLTWFPGRVGPFGSAQLRWGLVALALVGATVAGALLIPGSARPTTVFEGTWTSIDSGDGSTQYLVVGPGSTPSVRFVDQHATGLACRDDEVKVYVAEGHGVISESRLLVGFPDGGGCGLRSIDMPNWSLVYMASSDTLFAEGDRLTWTRAARDARPPTQAPAPSASTVPVATTAPIGDGCIQFDGPDTYTAPAGSILLTVDVPADPASPWIGRPDRFGLMPASCAGGSGLGEIAAAEITEVYTDACAGTRFEIDSAATAAEALAAAAHLDLLETSEVTIDGRDGTRLDMIVEADVTGCVNGQVAVADQLRPIEAALNFTVFILDVDGRTLIVALYGSPGEDVVLAGKIASIIASMQIEAADPASPAPTTDTSGGPSNCFDMSVASVYTANAGAIGISAEVPASADDVWQGQYDPFHLGASACGVVGPWIEAAVIDVVHWDACELESTSVPVATAAEAVAAIAAMTGVTVSDPIDATVDGYAGVRLDVTVPPDYSATACRGGAVLVANGMTTLVPGTTTYFVLDVDGTALTIAIYGDDGNDPALTAQLAAVIASLVIELP